MQPLDVAAYDRARDFSNKSFRSGCYAPYLSLLLDNYGNARVCCKNYTYLLGNVRDQSLKEIWTSRRMGLLRAALRRNNFDLGCEHCRWQIAEGNFANVFTRFFDEFPVPSETDPWPAILEFYVSNTCNLECVQCNGEFSSAIRARRERLPALPRIYDERFFAELAEFLPHLRWAKFVGGEPFLSVETFRIWDMLMGAELAPHCHVNTNATIRNPRVERILEKIPFSFTVSMDGATKETFERIRVGADFDEVVANFRWFLDYARRRGTFVDLNFCLMRENWREFGQFLRFGDEHDCRVTVSQVVFPSTSSLYTLPAERLAPILEELESQDASVSASLGRNRDVWQQELAQLRNRLASADGPKPVFAALRILEPFADAAEIDRMPVESRRTEEDAVRLLRQWRPNEAVDVLVCDEADDVVDVRGDSGGFLGIAREDCLGRRVDALFSQFRYLSGGGTNIVRVDEQPDFVDRILSFTLPGRVPLIVRTITVARHDERGRVHGSIVVGVRTSRLTKSDLASAASTS